MIHNNGWIGSTGGGIFIIFPSRKPTCNLNEPGATADLWLPRSPSHGGLSEGSESSSQFVFCKKTKKQSLGIPKPKFYILNIPKPKFFILHNHQQSSTLSLLRMIMLRTLWYESHVRQQERSHTSTRGPGHATSTRIGICTRTEWLRAGIISDAVDGFKPSHNYK